MKIVVALVVSLLAAGCASDQTAYPSLGRRAAEGIGFDEPTAAAALAVVADPALDATLTALAGKLDAVAKGFDTHVPRVQRASAVAGAATAGSEAWLNAQAALAALDDWRAQASGLTTEAEALGSERAATVGTPYPALETLRARAAAEADRQSAAIARLSAALPTP